MSKSSPYGTPPGLGGQVGPKPLPKCGARYLNIVLNVVDRHPTNTGIWETVSAPVSLELPLDLGRLRNALTKEELRGVRDWLWRHDLLTARNYEVREERERDSYNQCHIQTCSLRDEWFGHWSARESTPLEHKVDEKVIALDLRTNVCRVRDETVAKLMAGLDHYSGVYDGNQEIPT